MINPYSDLCYTLQSVLEDCLVRWVPCWACEMYYRTSTRHVEIP